MGACSSKKVTAQIAPDAIVSKQANSSAMATAKAKEHLKAMEAASDEEMDDTELSKLQKAGKEEARDDDKVAADFEEDGQRLHEPLWRAIAADDLAAATSFLDKNEIEEQDMYDAYGQSMLHKSAQLGHAEMLMLLLERTGAKPDLVNAQLATPLHVACRTNRENVVKFLIGCGVEANV